MALFKVLTDFVSNLDTQSITVERKQTLSSLVGYIQQKVDDGKSIHINFICTHNSRRSHLSQIWAQTMAHQFGIENVTCYSGGTEATALFPMVASTLANTGFEVKTLSEGKDPVYSIKFSENEHPVIGFSKRMDDDFNPKSDFAAIMTCSQADEGCPFVPGAEKRIPITYEDPKAFDGTSQQAEKYSERSKQIATEMFYVFSQIKK
ncbi:protein-tyrosine-phosphatase [Flagellimonas halotolerans]|uniref:Protein-tyrosine-phosphatase n=1 Tax=Flagellimonas halotolerans TaxID=3112164 RepID=A0ABU6ITZ8_9FLAO|nr:MULTISPECIES: protein-tyrosine-phosphatase [unclassified Allomuricauda]MEC3966585.1 protein-tyrosine-phosphatase [Muricauda sp. SYSU M86414]MEC4266442.1 protein-tyrosine-phosphatase [Muricauda sp. SYSU M84420]